MPRGSRLDAPGALHHVRARGIERRPIFFDDADREDFLDRLGRLVEMEALEVFAWALMPNHVHLLVRTGAWPLHRAMRALLAGYATRFNARHERAGHLFQNRYKSTLCEEEPYFLKLVQYIHLNPVPSVVPDLAALANYPYTGHSVLLGRTFRSWQNTEKVLAHFAPAPAHARQLYESFIRGGNGEEPRDLEGGGLVRSLGGWRYVRELRKGREVFTSDERILGAPRFVENALAEMELLPEVQLDQCELIELVCRAVGIGSDALSGHGRPRVVSRARRGIAYLWTLCFRRSGREMAARIGLAPSSLYEAARLGREEAAYWLSLLDHASAKTRQP